MASSPEPASPATSHSGQAQTMLCIPRRRTAWSSTTKTRFITWSRSVPSEVLYRRASAKEPRRRRIAGTIAGRSYLNDLILDGVANQFADRVQLEPAHDIGAMGFRGFHADVTGHRNFLAGLALGEELHNLSLAAGEPSASVASRFAQFVAAQPVHHHFGDLSGEKRTVHSEGFHGAHQITIGI